MATERHETESLVWANKERVELSKANANVIDGATSVPYSHLHMI